MKEENIYFIKNITNERVILNFFIIFKNNKKNINFRVKSIEKLNGDIINDYSFPKSSTFVSLKKFNNKEKFNIIINITKKELLYINKINFGLCNEGIEWIPDYIISFNIKNIFDSNFIIKSLYNDILNRDPDSSGFNHFKNKLYDKKISILELKNILEESEEFKNILNKNNLTFFSRIDAKDSLLRIPMLMSYFGKNKFKSNIYNSSVNFDSIDDVKMKDYVISNTNNNIFKKIICFDFSYNLNEIVNNNSEIEKYRYSMYEADDLPNEWVDKFKSEKLKKIIVPDDWCKKIYSKYFDNIGVVPLGTFYKDLNIIPNNNIFTFGYIARYEFRKNHKLLIQAFKNLFGENNNFKLKIHGSPGHHLNEILDFVKDSKNIFISYDNKNEKELNMWWSDINCYVMPSSGEGFSHTPREAIIRGIPAIVSNWSAHEKLVQLGIVRSFSPIGFEAAFKAVLFNRAIGNHAIFDIKDLQNEMEYVINNYNDCLKNTLIGRKFLIENESWEVCSKRLFEEVNEK